MYLIEYQVYFHFFSDYFNHNFKALLSFCFWFFTYFWGDVLYTLHSTVCTRRSVDSLWEL